MTRTNKATNKSEIKSTVTSKKETTSRSTVDTAKSKKEIRKFSQDDLIKCVSVTSGELLLEGKKTGTLYSWADYKDIHEVAYGDLLSLKLSHSHYLYDPLFLIEDENLLEQWKDVHEVYRQVIQISDINNLFNYSLNDFVSELKKLPIGLKESVCTLAAEKIADGSFDSINKIKAMDEIFGTELMLYVAK